MSRMITRSQKLKAKTEDNSSTRPESLKTTYIQHLNDDCLRNIFEFLQIKDLLKVERVCKRWQTVSKTSWQNVKILTIDTEIWGLNLRLESIAQRSKILKQVLNRCGRFLTKIDLEWIFLNIDSSFLSYIGELCPNLQFIDTGSIYLSTSLAKSIALNYHNLISIEIENCECNDASLSKIFRRNQKLKHLYLFEVNSELSGKCLLDLPRTIETIKIVYHHILSSQYICSALKCFKMIHTLSIGADWLDKIDTDDISTILPNNIRRLTMNRYNVRVHKFIMMQLNLELLDMSTRDVTDEFLFSLAKNCKNITELSLSSCSGITDAGIIPLSQQLNITVLDVGYTKITDQALKYMTNLRKLNCSGCDHVKDAGICTLIESSNKIEEIILNDTCVTIHLILEATRILLSRPDHILKIDVRYTSVHQNNMPYFIPHNLDVSFDDRSEWTDDGLSSESDHYEL